MARFVSHKESRPPKCAALFLMAAFLFLGIMLPPAVHASKVVVTVTGIVMSGTDVTGVFVGPRESLANYPFKLVYNYDDTLGKQTQNAPFFSSIENDGLQNPVVTAELTINGN